MRSIPNFVLMAPKDESELQRMLITSINYNGPTALRIPRGSGLGVAVICLLYTSPSPRDGIGSRMPSSA